MYAVAITELGGAGGDASVALAPVLGKTPYDTRLDIAGGVPALVATTPELARASDLAAKIRALGHKVFAFDTAAVVSSENMISMKRFRFEAGAIGVEDRPAERLPHDDVFALLRAVHKFDAYSNEQVHSKHVSVGRALATGGLMLTKTVTKEVKSVSSERCNVLYMFRSSGGTPWILREIGTHYEALGTAREPSQVKNFAATVARLRERMPFAAYDDRLLSMKRIRSGEIVSRPGVSTASSNVPWTDLLAHVVAFALSQRTIFPYRT